MALIVPVRWRRSASTGTIKDTREGGIKSGCSLSSQSGHVQPFNSSHFTTESRVFSSQTVETRLGSHSPLNPESGPQEPPLVWWEEVRVSCKEIRCDLKAFTLALHHVRIIISGVSEALATRPHCQALVHFLEWYSEARHSHQSHAMMSVVKRALFNGAQQYPAKRMATLSCAH